ncbi:Nucleoside diphosphate kinase 6 [Pseudolycoriella hygida]|uniref:Nucleoside diphosphate kinase n=1 Tax=Pseudolycoriella hygida TaxID=35572 RepID=A0A9Q0S806_9DIPT|nr:Nucleoside diphosphate kinase 6 [Pseudolycoriella hygida]
MDKFPLTFAIIKPHVVSNPVAFQRLQSIISDNKFEVIRSKQVKLTEPILAEFYGEHRDKFFYNRLITFMRSGETQALILHKIDAITSWRNLMGPTKVFKTLYSHPESLRGQFGLSDTRNACHGSDSVASVEKEVKIFFPDFNIHDWCTTSEFQAKQNRSR